MKYIVMMSCRDLQGQRRVIRLHCSESVWLAPSFCFCRGDGNNLPCHRVHQLPGWTESRRDSVSTVPGGDGEPQTNHHV